MNQRAECLLEVMFSCLNVPYVWGGNNPMTGLDCSGFVLWCLRSIGAWDQSDVTAQSLYSQLRLKYKSLSPTSQSFEAGDVLFYGYSVNSITHVAMAVDNLHMIEAGGGTASCKNTQTAMRLGACVRVRPIKLRPDLIAALSLWSTI